MKNIYNERINQRKAGVVILISYKVDFGAKKIIRDKEGYLIMIKKSIHQKDTAVLNVDVKHNRLMNT